jgi:uncharacterized Tic20 family protein
MTDQPAASAATPSHMTNPWAISAFILSLFGWLGVTTSIVSGILAYAALRDIKHRGEGGRALAQCALALAALLTIVVLLRGAHIDLTKIATC